eukprot:TRINITY_DN13507_c0_g1_i1.p1 TRINITY_DN13507_c0_g1~~TRINITY_DN13507_c0_g1_i1.p1  ORF type:complete len:155 (+),score=55.78 TRINITY_DN13507_c0_g1_i1:60-467(+)
MCIRDRNQQIKRLEQALQEARSSQQANTRQDDAEKESLVRRAKDLENEIENLRQLYTAAIREKDAAEQKAKQAIAAAEKKEEKKQELIQQENKEAGGGEFLQVKERPAPEKKTSFSCSKGFSGNKRSNCSCCYSN